MMACLNLASRTLLVVAMIFFFATGASADICTNCAGTGKQLSNWRMKSCGTCGGDGVVESGGLPTVNIGRSGYETNKFDLKAAVEKGGWKVAWADDISETDALQGVVAGGISVYSANPAPFVAWVEALVQRTVTSLEQSGTNLIPSVRSEIIASTRAVIDAAVRGKSPKEALRSFGQVDMKAGAIRHSGRNYVAGQTISRTWGIKPYIALRLRPAGNNSINGSPGIDDYVDPQQEPNQFDDQFERRRKRYSVILRTGAMFGAGTDADVYITVHGSLGVQHAVYLDNPGNDRERGDKDTYHFRWDDIGEAHSIEIWHDNSGVGPGWWLESVQIEDRSDNKSWFFDHDRWLATDEPDYRIHRRLSVTGAVN